ncbi:TIGR03085 family metal-binding protein [Tessaracoccus lubricantis]|uniref:TIGR03085 family metal-binding protein n=1 Tax=Tessaracoccus lubricantis TaxID=545543 RepID=A0ABP9FD73_9ACTN
MKFVQRQRAALADLLEELGPFAPTKCEGWQTQDLAAHLYVRERRLDALPGIASEFFSGHTERIQNLELHRQGYLPLVQAFREPGWIMRPVDDLVNASEIFIHHEDVLRANGRAQTLTAKEQQHLWPLVKVLARRAQLRHGGRLLLTRTDTGAEHPFGQGNRTVHLTGLPSELLLHLSRREADVEITGERASVEAWRAAITPL